MSSSERTETGAASLITTELLSMPLDERLAHVVLLERVITVARAASIAEARAAGMTWAQIGAAMGMSAQGAYDWFGRTKN